MADIILTAERLRERLKYDPETGVFTRATYHQHSRVGTRAGFSGYNNCVAIRIDGRAYAANNLAWLYVTGEWPVGKVRHVNGRNSDNRWANLLHAPTALTKRKAAARQEANLPPQADDFSDIA